MKILNVFSKSNEGAMDETTYISKDESEESNEE